MKQYANGSVSGLLVANGPYELHRWCSRLSDYEHRLYISAIIYREESREHKTLLKLEINEFNLKSITYYVYCT